MRHREKEIRKIEDALRAAYRRRGEMEPGPAFDLRVMQAVRRESSAGTLAAVETAVYERAVWRFAATASLLGMVFLIWFIQLDFESAHLIAELFIENSTGFDIAQSLGAL